MPRNKDLSAYTALVTGASSGIGLEYARQLAAQGANLVMVSIDREDLDREAKKIVDISGVSVETICMDLAQPDAANKLYYHCRQKGIQIEILINNAGIFSFQEITRTDPKKIETMLQLHIGTVTHLSRLFAADMCNRKHGYILNMSSLSWHSALHSDQSLYQSVHPGFGLRIARLRSRSHSHLSRRRCHRIIRIKTRATEIGSSVRSPYDNRALGSQSIKSPVPRQKTTYPRSIQPSADSFGICHAHLHTAICQTPSAR